MSQLLTSVIQSLKGVYPPSEARAIARMLLEEGPFELTASQLFAGKDSDLPESQQALLQNYIQRLQGGEPVQYVLGSTWFCGMKFKVGPGVLIPRPETEDLVQWVVDDWKDCKEIRILDACTGSGCIAVALAHQLPVAVVEAVDVSPDALSYAQANALAYSDRVSLVLGDVLSALDKDQPRWQVIVSNPPYVTQSERGEMTVQVKDFEPQQALFVPNEDPLCFYRALAVKGQLELCSGGALYVEINQQFGKEVCELFRCYGYQQVELRNDRFGNPRMVKGVRL
ncbi:MAG: peptide chain release factor N(5)-glutamine methyltransferase [Bacteroidaceae bacterium]|nr:peptide chain release factor N(5)-glutamine methyltransferase [Bacteroidaceae bacterium]